MLARRLLPSDGLSGSNISALDVGYKSFPIRPNDHNGMRRIHDCNEIVMMKESEPVKSNTPWTKQTSL
jgi:hypothetical protein